MRPIKLTPLFQVLSTLPGIGAKSAKLLEKLCGPMVRDLLFLSPTQVIDRSYSPTISQAQSGRIATLTVEIIDKRPSPTRRQPYRVTCSDETGEIDLLFFHPTPHLLEQLPLNEKRLISGKIESYGTQLQMVHPHYIFPLKNKDLLPLCEPSYPLTAGLSSRIVQKALKAALSSIPSLGEWISPDLKTKRNWPSWQDALERLHRPQSLADLSMTSPARERLAYDELLASQLALALMRQRQNKRKGYALQGTGILQEKLQEILPFSLTKAQKEAFAEIKKDMASPHRMMRLLQGDVGSGKTVVALLSMLVALEEETQAALMAPTEILATQHFETIGPLATTLGLKTVLLTGRIKGAQRKEALEQIASGEADIIIGTHALFQKAVSFKSLSLIIIDEQHRFGVHQRLTLAEKGQRPDILLMTATPIPRTLLMTAYGDLETSRLMEKPPGRKPIQTLAKPLETLDSVIHALKGALDSGKKIYWVCPLVEESEKVDQAAAQERYAQLHALFGDQVGLVHGRMKENEKNEAIAAFAKGNCNLLIATTVIEVGVNVPEASIMVIEHAERFGLAQLHQLRGRVGRSTLESSCLLLYKSPLSITMRKRLEIMRETEDGFRISEEDLKLRGGGEILGTRQSGLPSFSFVDLNEHAGLLQIAHQDARVILHNDPSLTGPRAEALRELLYLFSKDEAIVYLGSG